MKLLCSTDKFFFTQAREARRKYSQHERKLSALEKQEAELKVFF